MRTYLRLKGCPSFFEPLDLEDLLGPAAFQILVIHPEPTDRPLVGVPLGVAGQAVLPGVEEVLAPAIVDRGRDPFTPAQLADRDVTT